MSKPIFRSADLERIQDARAAETDDVTHHAFADEILTVTRDRPDLGIPAGTRLVIRNKRDPSNARLVVVHLNGDLVLRRVPITAGKVAGVVLGRFEEITDA